MKKKRSEIWYCSIVLGMGRLFSVWFPSLIKSRLIPSSNSDQWHFFKKSSQTAFRTCAIILYVSHFLYSSDLQAQDRLITINENALSLKMVLQKVEKFSGYSFIYNESFIDVSKPVDIHLTNATLKSVLEALFGGSDISYKIIDRQVVLTPKRQEVASLEDEDAKTFAKPVADERVISVKRKITGRVSDIKGESIPGATILYERAPGVVIGAVTDKSGQFSIELSVSVQFFSVSFVGYSTNKVVVTDKSNYLVTLKPQVVNLSETVITGFQTLSKERATGSFSTIKVEQLQKPTTNIATRLIGTTAGLQATQDAFGNPEFQIRGLTSLSSNAQPLVVVDGFPVIDGFQSINPNDVESISILKDAAAVSIWGARSANGVIVVKLKSAAKEQIKTTVQFNSFVNIASKIDYSYLYPNASSSEMVDYALRTVKLGNSYDGNQNNYFSRLNFNEAFEAINEHRTGAITETEMNTRLADLRKYDNTAMVKRYFYQRPISQQYNLSIANSTSRSHFILSALYEKANTEVKGSESQKFITSVKASVYLFRWLNFSVNGSFRLNDNDTKGAAPTGILPYSKFIDEKGNRLPVYSGMGDLYMPQLRKQLPASLFPYNDLSYNPITEWESADRQSTVKNYRIQAGFEFKIMEGLTFDSKFQIEQYLNDFSAFTSDNSSMLRQFIFEKSAWDRSENSLILNYPTGATLERWNSQQTTYNWRNMASLNRIIGDIHSVNAIAGIEIENGLYANTVNPKIYGYNRDRLTIAGFPNGTGSFNNPLYDIYDSPFVIDDQVTTFQQSVNRYVSAYANLAYTLLSKYTISGSARIDASNLITDNPKYRYAPFWSAGFNWNISQEEFMKKLIFIDHLNVRATYGVNGNVDKSTSPRPLIRLGYFDSFLNRQTASISNYGNPALTWERTNNSNFGVDFSFFKGKFYGNIDLYQKNGTNLLVTTSLPSSDGTSSQKLNSARMVNRGIEMVVSSRQRITDNISWTGSLNFSYNKNKVTNLYVSNYSHYSFWISQHNPLYVKNYDANSVWAFRYGGVVNKGTESAPNLQPTILDSKNQKHEMFNFLSGDMRDYWVNKGTAIAPYSIGFSTQLEIFNFQISAIFTGKWGHVFRSYQFNYPSQEGLDKLNSLYRETINADPGKVIPFPEKVNETYYTWGYYYPLIDYRVQDATHFRMQEVNLTYSIPKNLLQHISLTGATIFVQGNNLFTWTFNKYNEDPEAPIGSMKPFRTYTFGINVSL